jgi:YidC/Oxa1 family membrane protein insertase
MPYWEQLIGLLREAMFGYAQLTHGSLGAGIVVVTIAARLLLLPLSVKLGAAAARHQAALARLQPELDALRARHANDPRTLHVAMKALFAREGISMFPLTSVLGGLMQLPLVLALYSAVQQVAARGGSFLWIRDLARPDWATVAIASALTVATALAGPQIAAEQRMFLVAATALVTVITLSYLASGVGLYWGASSAVGIVQTVIIHRRRQA